MVNMQNVRVAKKSLTEKKILKINLATEIWGMEDIFRNLIAENVE